MNRVGIGGKGESVWLGWFLHTNLWRVRDARRGARRDRRARARWRDTRTSLEAARRSARLGRRLVPARLLRRRHAARLGRATTSAGSTRSRSPGPSSRAPADRAGAAARWPRSSEYLVRRGDGLRAALHAAVRPDAARSRATSRATCPACGRTAGSTRTRRVWSVLAFAALGDGDKAGELFAILNPINHASTRAGPLPLQGRALRRRGPTSTRRSPHVGRGGWTWYTGSAAWMYRAGMEWILASASAARRCIWTPASPRVAGLESRLPLPLGALPALGRKPARRRDRRRHEGHAATASPGTTPEIPRSRPAEKLHPDRGRSAASDAAWRVGSPPSSTHVPERVSRVASAAGSGEE